MAVQKATVKRWGKTLHVECAPTRVASRHEEEIALLLGILGHPEALVTDETRLSDFPIDAAKLSRIRKASGTQFGEHAKMIEVAEAVRRRSGHRKPGRDKE